MAGTHRTTRQEEEEETVNLQTTTTTRATEETWAGWIFHCHCGGDDDDDDDEGLWFFLSFPSCLYPLVNQCAMHQEPICIHSYQCLDLPVTHSYHLMPKQQQPQQHRKDIDVASQWLTQALPTTTTTTTTKRRLSGNAPTTVVPIKSLMEILPGGLTTTTAATNSIKTRTTSQPFLPRVRLGNPSTTRTTNTTTKGNVWTLGQYKRLKQMGEIARGTRISIQGRVKAVTPIVNLPNHNNRSRHHHRHSSINYDNNNNNNKKKKETCSNEKNESSLSSVPSHLFGLLELHQYETNTTNTTTTTTAKTTTTTTTMEHVCTVVLRSTFLQENAQPPLVGQSIVLHQVTRQEWRVPTVVAKHYDNDNNNKSGGHNNNNTSKQPPPYVPRYVFVVEHAHQIQMILEDEEDNDDDNDPSNTSTSVQTEQIITTWNKQPADQDNVVASPSLYGRRRQQQQQLEENSSRCDDNNKDWSLWEVVEGTIQSVHWIQTIPSRRHDGDVNVEQHHHDDDDHHHHLPGRQQIHYLELEPLVTCDSSNDKTNNNKSVTPPQSQQQQQQKRYILFLTYFPMDTVLQWSLRVGAMIRAMNVHACCSCCSCSTRRRDIVFAACIRSSVHLIQPSPLPRPTSSSSPKVVVVLPTIEPLWYARQISTKGGYWTWNQRRCAKQFMIQSGLFLLLYVPSRYHHNNDHAKNSNSLSLYCRHRRRQLDALVQFLEERGEGTNDSSLQKVRKQHQQRNVYVEFFHSTPPIDPSSRSMDYATQRVQEQQPQELEDKDFVAVDDEEDDHGHSRHEPLLSGGGGCCCLFWRTPHWHRPPLKLVTLGEIQELCCTQLQTRLAFYLSDPPSKSLSSSSSITQRGAIIKVGWTASFVLSGQELLSENHHPQQLRSTAATTTNLWTGGVEYGLDSTSIMSFGTVVAANGVSFPMVKRHDREVDCTDEERTPPPYRNGRNKDDETRPQTTKTDNGKRTVVTSHDAEDGTITLGRVHSIAISLLCVVVPSSLGTENDNYMTPQSFVSRDNVDVQLLPPTAIIPGTEKTAENENSSSSRGAPCGCFWVQTKNGLKFIANVFLVVDEIKRFGTETADNGDYGDNPKTENKDCLIPTSLSNGYTTKPLRSVRHVLEEPLIVIDHEKDNPKSDYFTGLLIRKFFRPKNVHSRKFSGCMFTLSHSPSTVAKQRSTTSSSSSLVALLQTVDIKTTLTVDWVRLHALKRRLNEVHRNNGLVQQQQCFLRDDQLALIHAWIQLASSPRSCPLLLAGFDELCSPLSSSSSSRNLSVQVRVPLSARQVDSKRGYIRFQCDLFDLSAHIIESNLEGGHSSPLQQEQVQVEKEPFDFVGGHDFITGMVHSRPARIGKLPGGEGVGLLSAAAPSFYEDNTNHHNDDTPPVCGIPVVSIGDLMKCLCLDLRACGRTNLAPSLVREIRNASLLGVSYCRVQAECRKCFSPLVTGTSKGSTTRTRMAGVEVGGDNTKRDGVLSGEEQPVPTFWHLPLFPFSGHKENAVSASDSNTTTSSITTVYNNHRATAKARRTIETRLQCPNGHDIKLYGAVKWECSGTLDDGTGQAKLYAERDAALVLMGLGTEKQKVYREWIEEAAWLKESGIIFSKALPLDPRLRSQVIQAKDCFRRRQKDWQRRSRATENPETQVLEHMDPIARGDYLLQRHLRWIHPQEQSVQRPQCFFVRCKPLSDNAFHHSLSVHQTEVRLTVPAGGWRLASKDADNGVVTTSACYRPEFSYSLPPLKLVLIDVATCGMECFGTSLDV